MEDYTIELELLRSLVGNEWHCTDRGSWTEFGKRNYDANAILVGRFRQDQKDSEIVHATKSMKGSVYGWLPFRPTNRPYQRAAIWPPVPFSELIERLRAEKS